MTQTSTPTAATVTFSWPRLLALHLVPGLAAVAVFAATAPLLDAAGLPPVWGMFLAVAVAVVPIEIGLIRRHGARLTGHHSVHAVVNLTRPRRRDLLRLLLPTLVGAVLAPALVQWAEPALHRTLGPVLPGWWQLDPGQMSGQPTWVVAVTVVGWLITFVVVGPIVEEMYFRGFLLPRIPAGRAAAVPVNAALFAAYHLWQPHAWLTVFAFAVPLAMVATRPRGLAIAAIVHCGVNALAFAVLFSGLVNR